MKPKNFDEFINEDVLPVPQPVQSNAKYIYVLIDKNMHSYEAILGIYDSFDKAIASKEWSKRGETPDNKGFGEDLFVYKEILNKDL